MGTSKVGKSRVLNWSVFNTWVDLCPLSKYPCMAVISCLFLSTGLPVDPSLMPDSLSMPSLLAGRDISLVGGSGKSTSSVIAEGMPPIPQKLLDKIRRWDYIDLALLLNDPYHKVEELPIQQQGQVILFQSVEQAQKRKKQIEDISSWVQAFSVYVAALSSAETTTREEGVGLVAHLHLINQLARELGGSQWLKYDADYREWAAAKGVRTWGELNLALYGRCLSFRLGAPTSTPSHGSRGSNSTASRSGGEKRSRRGACFQWNFDETCERVECHFSHSCYYCGKNHKAKECDSAKHARKRGPVRK